MKKEIKIMIMSAGILTLLCVTAFGPVPCSGVVVWSEYFDGPPDGWQLEGCDADEGWLRINGSKEDPMGDPIAIANRSSTVTVGTWDYDVVELGSMGGWLGVWFMADTSNFHTANYYAVRLTRVMTATGSIPVFGLYRSLNTSQGVSKVKLGSYDGPESPQGAHHIRVSRNQDGRIRVYVNGTLGIDVTDTEIDESTCFVFWDYIMDTALDNIVVTDEPETDGIPWWLVVAIGGVVIVVVALIIFKRRV
ncbi:MAG: hypothetical protein ACFFB7_06060 [Candidatus Sifarchaeia archaeon]